MSLLSAETVYPEDWTPDGRFLVFADYTLRRAGMLDRSGKSQTILDTPVEKREFRFSPDGRQIAYISLETGTSEAYIASLPAFAERRRVSTAGGLHPVWRKDGRELFYLASGRKLMSVEVKPGPAVEVQQAKPLFSVVMAGIGSQYGVTADGKRFLVNEIPLIEAEQLSVVVNWPADLKH